MKKQRKIKPQNADYSLEWWDTIYSDASKLSRWICLYEAVNMIGDKAQEKNIPFEKVEIKPLAIYKYMESTEDIMLKKILEQLYNIQICYSESDEDYISPSFYKNKKELVY
jgi:hypothetical protein